MKSFELEYNGTTYTMAMTRASLRKIEQQENFEISDKTNFSTIYNLFYASLITNYPTISKMKSDKMLDDLTTSTGDEEPIYDFMEIAEALYEISKPCYSNEGAAKKQIKKN